MSIGWVGWLFLSSWPDQALSSSWSRSQTRSQPGVIPRGHGGQALRAVGVVICWLPLLVGRNITEVQAISRFDRCCTSLADWFWSRFNGRRCLLVGCGQLGHTCGIIVSGKEDGVVFVDTVPMYNYDIYLAVAGGTSAPHPR